MEGNEVGQPGSTAHDCLASWGGHCCFAQCGKGNLTSSCREAAGFTGPLHQACLLFPRTAFRTFPARIQLPIPKFLQPFMVRVYVPSSPLCHGILSWINANQLGPFSKFSRESEQTTYGSKFCEFEGSPRHCNNLGTRGSSQEGAPLLVTRLQKMIFLPRHYGAALTSQLHGEHLDQGDFSRWWPGQDKATFYRASILLGRGGRDLKQLIQVMVF